MSGDKSNFIKEIENRLEARYGMDGKADKSPAEAGNQFIDSSGQNASANEKEGSQSKDRGRIIRDLKSSILSIQSTLVRPDATILKHIDDQISLLEREFSEDKTACAYLHIMLFLNGYLQAKRMSAHSDVVGLLISVFNHLETITSSEQVSEEMRWDMLEADIERYRKFVEQLDLSPDPAEGAESPGPAALRPPARQNAESEKVPEQKFQLDQPSLSTATMTPHEAFAQALEELKTVIRAEFSAIRAELKLWRESK